MHDNQHPARSDGIVQAADDVAAVVGDMGIEIKAADGIVATGLKVVFKDVPRRKSNVRQGGEFILSDIDHLLGVIEAFYRPVSPDGLGQIGQEDAGSAAGIEDGRPCFKRHQP